MSQLARPTSVWSCPLLSPVESLQPPNNISQHMPDMCLFSSHEPVALSQAVPGDFLRNLLMNKEQWLKMLHSCLRSVLWEVGSLGGCVWYFLPKLWFSGCFVPGKEGDFGGIAESLSREDHDTQGSRPWGPVSRPHPLITHLRDMQSWQKDQRPPCQGRHLSKWASIFIWNRNKTEH